MLQFLWKRNKSWSVVTFLPFEMGEFYVTEKNL